MPAPPGRKARVGAARGPQEFGIHHPPAKRAPPCRRSCGPSAGPGWACCRRPRPPRCWSRPAGVACRAESGAPWTAGPWRARPTWRGRLGTRGRRFLLLLPAAAGSHRAGAEAPLGRSSVGGPAPAGLGAASASATRRLASARAGLRCAAPRRAPPLRAAARRGSARTLAPGAQPAPPRRPAAGGPAPAAPGPPRRGERGREGGEGRRAAPPPPAAPQEVRREPSAAVLPASNLAFQEAGLVETARCPQSKCLTEIRGGKRRWRMLFRSTRDH